MSSAENGKADSALGLGQSGRSKIQATFTVASLLWVIMSSGCRFERTAERMNQLMALGDVYIAVEFFHPEVAPAAESRRVWDARVARVIEEIQANGPDTFPALMRSLLASLDDPLTGLRAPDAPLPAVPSANVRRAWSYHGFPPEVRDVYRGSYRPFTTGWRDVPAGETGVYRVVLPGGLAADIRYAAAGPEEPDSQPEVERSATADILGDFDAAFPSLGYRVIAAFRIRAAIRHFYPYSALTETDWDAAVREAIPELIAAADSVDYARAVAVLAARFKDSHVGLQGPGWSALVDGSRPPVGVRILESGEVVITGFSSDSVRRATGLERGDLVLAVDGRSIDAVIDSLAGLYSASTPQAMRARLPTEVLGHGAEGTVSRLRIRNAAGGVRTVEVGRTSDGWWRAFSPAFHMQASVRLLEGRVGYVDLTRLERSAVDSVFTVLGNSRAIIFDLRGYPRGTAWSIAPHLATRDSIPVALGWVRRAESPDPTEVGADSSMTFVPFNPHTETYNGSTILLLDERAQSQAEYTALMFRAANGTRFVGSATAGANGDITDIALPGRLRLSFTGSGSAWPDGSQLQSRGVAPDVEVTVSKEGVRAGTDEVLERALILADSLAEPGPPGSCLDRSSEARVC